MVYTMAVSAWYHAEMMQTSEAGSTTILSDADRAEIREKIKELFSKPNRTCIVTEGHPNGYERFILVYEGVMCGNRKGLYVSLSDYCVHTPCGRDDESPMLREGKEGRYVWLRNAAFWEPGTGGNYEMCVGQWMTQRTRSADR